jgi:Na+/pantothenate symporter
MENYEKKFYMLTGIFLLSLWIFSTLKFLEDAIATMIFGFSGIIAIFLLILCSFKNNKSRKICYAIASIIFGIIATLAWFINGLAVVPSVLTALFGILLFTIGESMREENG